MLWQLVHVFQTLGFRNPLTLLEIIEDPQRGFVYVGDHYQYCIRN